MKFCVSNNRAGFTLAETIYSGRPSAVAEVEPLEQRRLFSALFNDGALTVHGTTANDTISLTAEDGNLQVSMDGEISTFAISSIHSITIYGYQGDDLISVGNGIGDCSIRAGAGDDTVISGNGNDTILGGDGNDLIYGNDGNDHIEGLAGNDTLYGGGGNDTILGGYDDDLLFGEAGNDELRAGLGNDIVFAGIGNDTLYGGDGNDQLFGGDGDDQFFTRDGYSDTLDGGLGNDHAQFEAIDNVLNIEDFLI